MLWGSIGCFISKGIPKDSIIFYDDQNPNQHLVYDNFIVLKNLEQLKINLSNRPEFCPGVGGPAARIKLHTRFVERGGKVECVMGQYVISDYSNLSLGVDIPDQVYIGPATTIGIGTLLNTKASVHPYCVVEKFCEIGPGPTLLGGTALGDYISLGSRAVILPGLWVGSNAIVEAGCLATQNIPGNSITLGVPGLIVKKIKR